MAKLLLIFLLTLASVLPIGAQTAILEDFSTATIRKAPGGSDLFSAYLGEDPQQTYLIENGMLRVNGAPNTGSCDPGCGIYMHFFPAPYNWPSGFAQSFIKSGTWDSTFNRMRFKMKCSRSISRRSDGGGSFDIGTYVKQHVSGDPAYQGMHYYHGFDPNVYANRWMLVELTSMPQHRVGDTGSIQPPLDPEWVSPSQGNPVHYFDGLTRFYMDTALGSAWAATTCYLDDFVFGKDDNEADQSVSSLTATHNGSAYEVTWACPKNQDVVYEVRHSASSMKTAGFAAGKDGGTVRSTGNSYPSVIWTSPAVAEAAPGYYVAIRPQGQTVFSEIYIPAMNSGGTQPPTSACDINGDGVVNETDVTAARDAALGRATCIADLDGNGKCDVVDAQRVINASLGQSCRVGP